MSSVTISEKRTVKELISWAQAHLLERGLPEAAADAEVLLSGVLGQERWRLAWMGNSTVKICEQARFREWVTRRGEFEPLHYILGVREFWSLDFRVGPQVLIPRPETEILVEEALRCSQVLGPERNLKILDVGTGSGNIAVALARELPRAKIVAIDCSPGALRVAAENCRVHGVLERVSLLGGDLVSPLGRKARFPLVVANLPYIDPAQLDFLPEDVRNYEPRVALDGGKNGIQTIARLFATVPSCLADGGFFLVEIGPGQSGYLRGGCGENRGLQPVRITRDFAGVERVFVSRKEGVGDG